MPNEDEIRRAAAGLPKPYTEEQIYRDAWRIADPGASNPVAVAGTLAKASAAMLHDIGTDGVRNHPALRVMAGQLAMLYDVTAIGAEMSDYDKVKAVVDHLDDPDVGVALWGISDQRDLELAQMDPAERRHALDTALAKHYMELDHE